MGHHDPQHHVQKPVRRCFLPDIGSRREKCPWGRQGIRAFNRHLGVFVQALPQPVKSQVLDAHLETLKAGWYGAMAFGATALIAVAVEKHVPLRTELGSMYGMEEKANKDRQDVDGC